MSKPEEPTKKAEIEVVDDSERRGFAVQPKRHCEHCDLLAGLLPNITLDLNAPCGQCGNVGENMQCLSCFSVYCGRHVKGHMLEHHEQTNHPMVVGFADLSFWCYPCESYLSSANPKLRWVHGLLYEIKFPSGGALS
jgi:histone deacetylase 6